MGGPRGGRRGRGAVCVAGVWLGVLALGACGPQKPGVPDGGSNTPPPLLLQAAGGSYGGGGSLGLALLATLRDRQGSGPSGSWTLQVLDPTGTAVASAPYDAAGPGSFLVGWWDDGAYAAAPGYQLAAIPGGGGQPLAIALHLAASTPLVIPTPSLSPDGATLSWPAVPGAAVYRCQVSDSSGIVDLGWSATASCDVSALPDGSYLASIVAASADPNTVSQEAGQDPALPANFDVSAGHLGFVRGASPGTIDAVGGSFSDGTDEGLAFWIALRQPDGTPTGTDWTVTLTGPGIDAAAPLTVSYPGSELQALFWSYDVPPSLGTYQVMATDGTETLSTQFSVNPPAPLDVPAGVQASTRGNGTVEVSWSPVIGATSELVAAYRKDDGSFVAAQWVGGNSASFPSGTLPSGVTVELYVDATNADMISGAVPGTVAV